MILEVGAVHVGEPGDGFAAAFDEAFGRLCDDVAAACAGQAEWALGVTAGVRAAFDFAIAQPDAARLLTDEALRRGEDGQARHRGMVRHFAGLLRSATTRLPAEQRRTPVVEEGIVAGIVLLIGSRLRDEQSGQLEAIVADAAQFALIPYVGAEEARRLAAGTLS